MSTPTTVQCEGYRRRGGAFTLGIPQWEQCTSDATVTLDMEQNGQRIKLPSCPVCWEEARNHPQIKIIEATPIIPCKN